jgi:transposase-like protein
MSKEVQLVSGRVGQTFSEDQKRKIVDESYASELSLNKFAKRMGISPATLCNWRKALSSDCSREEDRKLSRHLSSEFHALASHDNDKAEIQKLQNENTALKAEFCKFKAYAMNKIYELEAHKYP